MMMGSHKVDDTSHQCTQGVGNQKKRFWQIDILWMNKIKSCFILFISSKSGIGIAWLGCFMHKRLLKI
jgi:hypothetical protein